MPYMHLIEKYFNYLKKDHVQWWTINVVFKEIKQGRLLELLLLTMGAEMLKFPGKVRNKHKKWKEVKFLWSTVNIYMENLQVVTDKTISLMWKVAHNVEISTIKSAFHITEILKYIKNTNTESITLKHNLGRYFKSLDGQQWLP